MRAHVTWINKLGIDVMMTNSAKTAYYAPTLNKVNVSLASLNQCINTGCA
jgi:predicted aconitase